MERRPLPRLAWFTPLPPVRSGIAGYSFELLPGLAADYQIDVFVAGHPTTFQIPDERLSVRDAHDFVWMHARRPYDLVVYQLGNATCHDYMWAYMVRYPGLIVLHDGQLHHARGRLLREQRRFDDYLDEFSFDQPGIDPAVGELGISGRLGSLTFLWPMRRVVVESARMLAVHSRWLADQVSEEHPEARVAVLEMGVPASAPGPGARQTVRTRHGIPEDAVLFVALGEVTREKRIPQAIRQLTSISHAVPAAHLLLAGTVPSHYDPVAEAQACGVEDRVTVAGYVPDEQMADYLEAADVCLCLRWPTSRETSAAWLRCLAAGRPTVVTDLVHSTDIPAYDPRGWTVLHATASRTDDLGWPIPDEPACVSIDILDEDHSLRLAMHRLATDSLLRQRLGRRARALWAERFTLDRMVAAYKSLITAACVTPMPADSTVRQVPAHFRTDGTEYASRLLRQAGLADSAIADIWSTGSGQS